MLQTGKKIIGAPPQNNNAVRLFQCRKVHILRIRNKLQNAGISKQAPFNALKKLPKKRVLIKKVKPGQYNRYLITFC